MVIRGGNSDILSAQTVEAMRRRRARLDVVDVADEGHAPALTDAGLVGRIVSFVSQVEAEAPFREYSL